MKIINKKTMTPHGFRFNLNPEFVDILAQDPVAAMNVIDALERFDRKQWRDVMRLFAVSGLQRTYESLNAGETRQYCYGKRKVKKHEDD